MESEEYVLSEAIYHKFKSEFVFIRNKYALKHQSILEVEDGYTHIWTTPTDTLTAKYLKKDNSVRFIHDHEKFSDFSISLNTALSKYKEVQYTNKTTKGEKDNIYYLKRNFLYSMGIDPETNTRFKESKYSEEFIQNTLKAIEEGRLSYLPRG